MLDCHAGNWFGFESLVNSAMYGCGATILRGFARNIPFVPIRVIRVKNLCRDDREQNHDSANPADSVFCR